MLKYIIKRILLIIPVIIGITLFIYLVMDLAPGDPAFLLLGPEASQEELEELRVELGLNRNVFVRYGMYMINALQGDLGNSWITGNNVLDEFAQRVPNTFILALMTLVITITLSIPLGLIAAVNHNKPVDGMTLVFAMVFSSLPFFWFAMLMQILFALNLGIFPSMGAGSLRHFILPSLTLGFANMASQVRMCRSSMLDVLSQDYIRTAHAKGARKIKVVFNHVLRNGLLPVATQLGLSFAATFGGAIVTETVFSIPGIGIYMITATRTRDVPVVMGVIIFVAVFVAVVNLVVDLIYAFIDPKVKRGYGV